MPQSHRRRRDQQAWTCRGTVAGLLLAAALAFPGIARTKPIWRQADPDYAWSFPRDHWTHPDYRTEWWYLTGHLHTDDPAPRHFGYQLTLFRVGILPEKPAVESNWATGDLVMGHAAITDLDEGTHLFSELLYRAAPQLGRFPLFSGNPKAGDLLAWAQAPAGTDTSWSLRWNGSAFDLFARDEAKGIAFSLSTRPARPLVLEGPNGFSRKGEAAGAASEYYSFTRLETRGTLEVAGRTFAVGGLSWMDKEFGSGVLGEDQSGWDWFSLQLEDGRDLMLYLLRTKRNTIDYARGTLVSAEGEVRILERGDFTVRATDSWKSPETGATYPARWDLSVPGATPPIDLQVVPEVADQEDRGKLAGGLFYWEGAVAARTRAGAPCGQGYVELTGYGTKNRPAL
jgi:predicted secreted hydrolase